MTAIAKKPIRAPAEIIPRVAECRLVQLRPARRRPILLRRRAARLRRPPSLCNGGADRRHDPHRCLARARRHRRLGAELTFSVDCRVRRSPIDPPCAEYTGDYLTCRRSSHFATLTAQTAFMAFLHCFFQHHALRICCRAWPRPRHTLKAEGTSMDILTTKARSALMARIRGKNTKPELIVRRLLHSMGHRFRLHRRDLPGTPDIVLAKYRVAMLVNGCFFHHHRGCRLAYVPKTRTEFWRAKFAKNSRRDQKVKKALRDAGWTPIVVWECETKRPGNLAHRLATILIP